MDPFTVALAVFGIQKLRGKSTGKSFRDALLAAGGVQLGATAGIEGLQGFSGLGASGTNALAGEGFLQQLGNTYAGQGIASLYGTPGTPAVSGVPEQTYRAAVTDTAGNVLQPERVYQAAIPAKEAVPATGWLGLDTGTKLGIGIGGLSAASALLSDTPEKPKALYTQEDYDKAYAAEKEKLKNMGAKAEPSYATSTNLYNYNQNPMYAFNQGGIVDALPKFAVGGVNFMPSKVTHDENDINNYVRASGYVEDGSGTGDKDTDTILAQLADGEFVSRSDAVLGAGIMAGASPNNMKEMRKLGAAYFYDQQAKFKRIFDLLDASRKTN